VPCGRIDVQGKTMVPDERRGKLRLCKDTDGLTHLQWGTRAPDMPFAPETDLLVFPQEAEMKFIPKPGVFVIKFPEDPSRNMFFWSQRSADEAEKEGDDELAADVNAALNGEAPAFATRRGDAVARRARAVRAAQAAAASALSGQEETPAVTAGVAATPAAPEKASQKTSQEETREDETMEDAAAAPGAAVSGDALRAALAGAGGGGGVGNLGDPAAMARMLAGMNARGRGLGLNEVLTPETVGPLLRDDDVRARLAEFLPDAHRGSENLDSLLRTPQFQSQLERFSAALQSGQMDLAQFGLSPGTGFSVAEFLDAIQKKADEKRDAEEKKKDGGNE
jgi:26S proteasome regulatory subunit N13